MYINWKILVLKKLSKNRQKFWALNLDMVILKIYRVHRLAAIVSENSVWKSISFTNSKKCDISVNVFGKTIAFIKKRFRKWLLGLEIYKKRCLVMLRKWSKIQPNWHNLKNFTFEKVVWKSTKNIWDSYSTRWFQKYSVFMVTEQYFRKNRYETRIFEIF